MIYNRIPVVFGNLRKITIPPVSFQYDIVQKLIISGLELPEYYQVDFCNEGDTSTITMVGTADGVDIPDQFLQTGRTVIAYLVITGTDTGAVETRYQITIPVNKRPTRTDIEPTPAEQSTIDSLIAAMNDAVDDAEASATAAEGFAENAEASADRAEQAAQSIDDKVERAEAAAQAAGVSATRAEDAAEDALAYKNDAAQSAGSASSSAEDARDSKETAIEKAAEAEQSAAQAVESAESADGDAQEAEQAAQQAEASANAAEQSATAAQGSATAASGSATVATNKAAEASASATTATNKATEAANSATAAQTAQTGAEAAQAAAEAVLESIPEDYSELSDDVSELKNAFTSGINLFNKSTVTTNKIMGLNGPVTLNSGAYSEFIPVEPSTTYYVSRALGSSSRPTLIEYDSTQTALSQLVKGSTAKFSFTTSENTRYIVVNTTTPYLDVFSVCLRDPMFYSSFGSVGGGKVSRFSIVSASPIYYDGQNLISKTGIMLVSNDNVVTLGSSVDVGSGGFLFYNSVTGVLYADDTFKTDRNIFFVSSLSRLEFANNNYFDSLTALNAPIELDAINRIVKITCTSQTYLYAHGAYYTLSAEQSVTLTPASDHFIVYYSMSDNAFNITSSYSDIIRDRIVIAEFYRSQYRAICEVKMIGNKNALSGKRYFTFGDSLTWYDGHEFNRGIHEGEVCRGYQTYLNYYANMSLVVNAGQSGKTTSQICATLEAYDFPQARPDYFVFIMGGNNDDRLDVPIGTLQPVGGTFDTSTVYGSLQHAIESVQTAHPQYRIILMTEPMGWTYENGTLVLVNPLIADAYRKVAETYALPLIDLWKESGINAMNRDTYYADPPTASNRDYMYHPNNDGWERLSRIICNEVMKL